MAVVLISAIQGRSLTRPVELHGCKLPEGARVLLINGATGRDPRRFRDPNLFDVIPPLIPRTSPLRHPSPHTQSRRRRSAMHDGRVTDPQW